MLLQTLTCFVFVRPSSRKLAMLAGVPLALARNRQPGAWNDEFLESIRLRNPGKMHNFEIFRQSSHLGCLDRLKIQHEEKTFHGGRVLHDGNVGFHLGGVFLVTFVQLPFRALPLLSLHLASFRSLTPRASSSGNIFWRALLQL